MAALAARTVKLARRDQQALKAATAEVALAFLHPWIWPYPVHCSRPRGPVTGRSQVSRSTTANHREAGPTTGEGKSEAGLSGL